MIVTEEQLLEATGYDRPARNRYRVREDIEEPVG